MLASTASAPRVTRCSLGLYWSRDLCTAGWLAGWGMLSYLGQMVRGSEIWWFMTSAHSLSTSLSSELSINLLLINTGELGYDGLNGTRKIGPSYAKSVVYIWRILDMHRTGTKHIVRHMQKSVVQWSVISKFTCIIIKNDNKDDINLIWCPLRLPYNV